MKKFLMIVGIAGLLFAGGAAKAERRAKKSGARRCSYRGIERRADGGAQRSAWREKRGESRGWRGEKRGNGGNGGNEETCRAVLLADCAAGAV